MAIIQLTFAVGRSAVPQPHRCFVAPYRRKQLAQAQRNESPTQICLDTLPPQPLPPTSSVEQGLTKYLSIECTFCTCFEPGLYPCTLLVLPWWRNLPHPRWRA